jgi:hypothetical protein
MTKSAQTSTAPEKKPYSTPKLVVYGALASMTAGVNGTKADTGQGQRTKLG